MKLKFLKGKIFLEHQLKKNETYKVDERKGIFSLSIYKKPQWVNGITSYCEDGKHCLFLDFDGVCQWIVEQDLKKLAEKYPPFYLFSTRGKFVNGEKVGHYHAICLKKFYPNEIVNIQRETHCDNAYITMPLRSVYRSWVLRLSNKKRSGKPQFVKIIGRSNLNEEISLAHLTFLNRLYGLPRVNYNNIDKSKKVYYNVYQTG